MLLFSLHGALGHTDGTSGADDAAEVATYAFSAYQSRTTGFGIERDGLMTSIVARYLAAPTAYALLRIELGIDDGVTVELSWSPERRQLFANPIRHRRHWPPSRSWCRQPKKPGRKDSRT